MATNIDKEYDKLLNATPESAPEILENMDKIEEPVNAMSTISEIHTGIASPVNGLMA